MPRGAVLLTMMITWCIIIIQSLIPPTGLASVDIVVRKGFPADVEAYSCFHDILRQPTGLWGILQEQGVTELYICGMFSWLVGGISSLLYSSTTHCCCGVGRAAPVHLFLTSNSLSLSLSLSHTHTHTPGVATDVAVINTVLDALQHFHQQREEEVRSKGAVGSVYCIEDAVRGFVEINSKRALAMMKEKGAILVQSSSIVLS